MYYIVFGWFWLLYIALLLQCFCLSSVFGALAWRLMAPPRHYTVDPTLLQSRNPFNCHEDVLSLQPMIPPKRFDIFLPVWDTQKV